MQQSNRFDLAPSLLTLGAVATILLGLSVWGGSTPQAANTSPPPYTLHGYYWKHIAVATTTLNEDIVSVSIEANINTTSPPLAAIGTDEGVEVFAYKPKFLKPNLYLPTAWRKEATLVGTYVSISGNRLAIGRPGVGGDVRVFERSSVGQWTQLGGDLVAPVAAFTEAYGSGVELDGNRLIVGMPHPGAGPGKAFIYDFVGGQWQTSAELVGDVTQADSGHTFGADVSLSEDTIAVAERGEGCVHLYRLSGGVWSFVQSVSARDPANPSQPADPGNFLAMGFARTIVLRGARLGVRSEGYLQMFERIDSGAPWTYRETFIVEAEGTFTEQRSVAFDGKSLLAGEPFAGNSGGRVQPLLGPLGGPYFPTSAPPPWIPEFVDHRIKESPEEADSLFGRTTAVDDGWLAIAGNRRLHFYQKTAY